MTCMVLVPCVCPGKNAILSYGIKARGDKIKERRRMFRPELENEHAAAFGIIVLAGFGPVFIQWFMAKITNRNTGF